MRMLIIEMTEIMSTLRIPNGLLKHHYDNRRMFYIPVEVGLFKFNQLNVPFETWGKLTCFFLCTAWLERVGDEYAEN